MHIERHNYQDTLRMRFNLGPDPEDPTQDLLRVRSYTRIKHDANDEHLWGLAKGFEALFAGHLVNTYRVMHVELVESQL